MVFKDSAPVMPEAIRQRVRLHVASGLIQAILNLAKSALLGLPFTPTLIQSGWTRSPATELLKLRLRLQWLSPGHHSWGTERSTEQTPAPTQLASYQLTD